MTPLLKLHTVSVGADVMVAVALADSVFFAESAKDARGEVLLGLIVTTVLVICVSALYGHSTQLFSRKGRAGPRRLVYRTRYPLPGDRGRPRVALGRLSPGVRLPCPLPRSRRHHQRAASGHSGPGKANANLTFVGIAAVTIGALASVVPLDVASGRAALGLAAAVLVIGRYATVRFDRFIPVPDKLIDPERLELHSVAVRLSASALASTRGAVGYLIVSVGFLLRMAGEPTWVIAALVAAAASGEALGPLAVRALGSKAGSLFAVATALAAAGAALLLLARSNAVWTFVAAGAVMGAVAAAARLIVEVRLALDSPDPYAVLALSRIDAPTGRGLPGGSPRAGFPPVVGMGVVARFRRPPACRVEHVGSGVRVNRRNPAVR